MHIDIGRDDLYRLISIESSINRSFFVLFRDLHGTRSLSGKGLAIPKTLAKWCPQGEPPRCFPAPQVAPGRGPPVEWCGKASADLSVRLPIFPYSTSPDRVHSGSSGGTGKGSASLLVWESFG